MSVAVGVLVLLSPVVLEHQTCRSPLWWWLYADESWWSGVVGWKAPHKRSYGLALVELSVAGRCQFTTRTSLEVSTLPGWRL